MWNITQIREIYNDNNLKFLLRKNFEEIFGDFVR